MAVTAPASLGSPGRALAHFIGVACGWTLFVLGWQRIVSRPWDAHELWVLIVASTLVLPMLTGIWIAHNIGLYRGRRRRNLVTVVEARYETDWSGRTVDADWSALAHASRIHIDVEADSKRYRAVADGAPMIGVDFSAGAATGAQASEQQAAGSS